MKEVKSTLCLCNREGRITVRKYLERKKTPPYGREGDLLKCLLENSSDYEQQKQQRQEQYGYQA